MLTSDTNTIQTDNRKDQVFAPSPVILRQKTRPILACGGDLKNVFSLAWNNTIYTGPLIGNLENADAFRLFTRSIENCKKKLGIEPEIVAVDKHPGYFSSRYGSELDLPLIEVQHHHAHIASVMAEHGLEGKVIGLALDGTGYGDDGSIWGGEILLADYSRFSRMGYFKPLLLPGGDAAIREPWRIAAGILFGLFRERMFDIHPKFIENIGLKKIQHIINLIKADINCPLSSGAGRLFDGVASILNVLHENTFEGQAPIKLEEIANPLEEGLFEHNIEENGEINFVPMLRQLISWASENKSISEASARFHNTIALALVKSCKKIRKESNRVVLAGGVFQNKFLLKRLVPLLEKNNFEVILPNQVPINDSGLSIGQAVIAIQCAGRIS